VLIRAVADKCLEHRLGALLADRIIGGCFFLSALRDIRRPISESILSAALASKRPGVPPEDRQNRRGTSPPQNRVADSEKVLMPGLQEPRLRFSLSALVCLVTRMCVKPLPALSPGFRIAHAIMLLVEL
jgi:hypothetical protein